jgi:two-component system C4-dicarboxylate transport sensor histidine kinase DctB
VGTTRSESGYYLSAPLGDRDRPVGVAVVKIGLEPLENRWQGNDSQMLLADENGVVILASDPSWKLAACVRCPTTNARSWTAACNTTARPCRSWN